MASIKEYLDFTLEQLSLLNDITYKSMMGEYIIYYREKIVGGVSCEECEICPRENAGIFAGTAV